MKILFYICSIAYVLCEFYLKKEKGKIKDVIIKTFMIIAFVFVLSLPVINIETIYFITTYVLIYLVTELVYIPVYRKYKNNNSSFLARQILHFATLAVLIYLYKDIQVEYSELFKEMNLVMQLDVEEIYKYAFAAFLIMNPSNIVIQRLIGNYKPDENEETQDNRIGRKIGSIERLIMLIFIALDQYAAMGLVLTAKSIARYDKISKDKVFAEYYLLGTLLSTLVVVIVKIMLF